MDSSQTNTQPVPQQALTENTAPQKGSLQYHELPLELIVERVTLYRKKVIEMKTHEEVALESKVSISHVRESCYWVEANWVNLTDKDKVVKELVMIDERIRELNIEIAEVKLGDPVVFMGTVLRDAQGNPIKKKNRNALTQLVKERREYEKMRMEIEGVLKKTANMLVANDVHINNSTNNNIQNKIAIIDKMEQADKEAYLKLIGKYAHPPSRI